MFKWHYESSCEVEIPIVPVWDFSVNPSNWRKFIEMFEFCELDMKFQKGAKIKVGIRNTHISILITDVEYLKKYQYEIKQLFFFQESKVVFEKISPTRTKIISGITVTSFLTPFLKSYFRKKVDKQCAKFLEVLAETEFKQIPSPMSNNFLNQLQAAHEQGVFATFIKDSAASGELFKIIPALKGLDKVPQDPRWHPEGDVWTHTLLVVENLPSNATFAMALSALFHDTGKKYTSVILDTGRISAHGHESVSKKIASEVLDDLGADSKLKEEVLFLVYRHMLAHSKDTKEKTLRKLILEAGPELVDQLLLHGVADVKSGCGDFKDCIRLRELFDNMEK